MTEVTFLISNDRHHPAMLIPVIRHLIEQSDVDCRVLSLCELRGRSSPRSALDRLGVPWRRVLTLNLRKGAVARGISVSKRDSGRHRKIRAFVWRCLLGPRIAGLLSSKPRLVVLPNDAAYPYDRIVRMLGKTNTPYLLVQEGIRFELPGVKRESAYGRGGASAIAAWGESSVAYFRDVGVEPDRIHVTGNPRFDHTAVPEPAPAPRDLGHRESRERKLLLVTNPVEEQGYCSAGEKLALVRRFVDGITPLVEDGTLQLTLRLHSSESKRDYLQALSGLRALDRLEFAEDVDLFSLLARTDVAVIMASTVGLEALLFGVRLGVLELPGTGFVFDYVSDEAAQGLTWSRPMAPQVRELLDYDPRGASRFLRHHLHRSTTEPAAAAIARLVLDLTKPSHPESLSHGES
ncbi:MAG: hypothetical protein GY769_11000 [bacterium]|nr:hypothetical protein [bacterium]